MRIPAEMGVSRNRFISATSTGVVLCSQYPLEMISWCSGRDACKANLAGHFYHLSVLQTEAFHMKMKHCSPSLQTALSLM